ncbi:MAG: 4Fe-4S binding protein, partial [Phoenicibacter congonensis]|nr:4Fe-4S binding protein [Phoenicibacter congonensis]
AGGVFFWKLFLLLAILVSAVLIPRSFCRYLCPLGALYSLFNRFSLYRMELDRAKCVGCKKCEHACPMAVEVTKDINSGECIRCGRCRAACPADAISCGFLHPRNKDEIATAEKS